MAGSSLNKEPYSEGYAAQHNGYRLSDNPYKRFTDNWSNWKQGWCDNDKDDPYYRKLRALQYRIKNKIKQTT